MIARWFGTLKKEQTISTRCGHGEGSIYQRSDNGLWCTVVDLGVVNGKRKRKYIYGRTRKEVAEKLKVVLRDQQQGVLCKNSIHQFSGGHHYVRVIHNDAVDG